MRRHVMATFSIAVLALFGGAEGGCQDDSTSLFDDSNGDRCEGIGCPDNGHGSACFGLTCQQVACGSGPSTNLTGKVYDPAGKVPLYNVLVYVPNGSPEPLVSGLGSKCDTCAGSVTGSPITSALTDASGSFRLENVPADIDFPLVIQIGKWRRVVTVPKVAACTSAVVDDRNLTRLPRNRTEGDIPRIALATGSADPLECLLRKVGVDDSEFGTAGSEARIHLYAGGGTVTPAKSATSSFKSGGSFKGAATLWNSLDELKKYDVVLLSCEGDENASTKPASARQALYDYTKLGGRLFSSHFHHYWFSNSPEPTVKSLASWTNDFTCKGTGCTFEREPAPDAIVNAAINTTFPKGAAMKEWLEKTGSLTNGELPIQEMRHNVNAVTPNALSWITVQNPAAAGKLAHEYVSFNTPVGASDEAVCGRVVYSDLHVGAGDATGLPFPEGCSTPDLTPQQKALEFMLFDLSSCIQRDDQPPQTPR